MSTAEKRGPDWHNDDGEELFVHQDSDHLVASEAGSAPLHTFDRASSAAKRVLFGRNLSSAEEGEQRLSKRLALPIFSSDAISSSAYASEEILLALVGAGALASSTQAEAKGPGPAFAVGAGLLGAAVACLAAALPTFAHEGPKDTEGAMPQANGPLMQRAPSSGANVPTSWTWELLDSLRPNSGVLWTSHAQSPALTLIDEGYCTTFHCRDNGTVSVYGVTINQLVTTQKIGLIRFNGDIDTDAFSIEIGAYLLDHQCLTVT